MSLFKQLKKDRLIYRRNSIQGARYKCRRDYMNGAKSEDDKYYYELAISPHVYLEAGMAIGDTLDLDIVVDQNDGVFRTIRLFKVDEGGDGFRARKEGKLTSGAEPTLRIRIPEYLGSPFPNDEDAKRGETLEVIEVLPDNTELILGRPSGWDK